MRTVVGSACISADRVLHKLDPEFSEQPRAGSTHASFLRKNAPQCDLAFDRPSGGVLANYWTCLPRNQGHSRHVKTIVNTRHALQMIRCAAAPTDHRQTPSVVDVLHGLSSLTNSTPGQPCLTRS